MSFKIHRTQQAERRGREIRWCDDVRTMDAGPCGPRHRIELASRRFLDDDGTTRRPDKPGAASAVIIVATQY